jgi:hypothetical protein
LAGHRGHLDADTVQHLGLSLKLSLKLRLKLSANQQRER